jgi:hypothetical protein
MRKRWAALFAARFAGTFRMDPDTLGAIIIAMGLGTGAQRVVDPELPGSDWVELLRTLVGSALSGVT